MSNNTPMVRLSNVCKTFGKNRALNNVSLEFGSGRIIGLLGANGSGKSTLLRHIVGLYPADSGECMTLGAKATELEPVHLARIGYVHQEGALPPWMSVQQLIRYVSVYYPNWNHQLEERYVQEFGLPLHAGVGRLSPGQRQQVAILLAIGFEPELLLLDEPASALDPLARGRFLDLLLRLIQDEKRTIVISSHILSDIEKVVDHVLIMQAGFLLRDSSLDALREEYIRFSLKSLNGPLPDPLPFEGIVSCQVSGTHAVVTLRGGSSEQIEEYAYAIGYQIEFRAMLLDELYALTLSEQGVS